MITILLIIVYIAFISLGLPDSMLGAAWPTIQQDLSLPVEGAGLISFIIAGGTIVSSLLSGKLIKKLGTGKLTLISVFMTALPLLGYSLSHNYISLCLLGIPLGLGAGAVDAALNNFIAMHFSARHMNWLHCFWGVGATTGPIIMSLAISRSGKWQNGYLIVAIIQIVLVITLLLSLPIWNKFKDDQIEEQVKIEEKNIPIMQLPGVLPAMVSFFCYCALEAAAGLWGASYLVRAKGIQEAVAAGWVSMFYLGITIGRFINGLFTVRFSNAVLVRAGQVIIGLGALVLMIFTQYYANLFGLVLIGLGCAPIYPSMLHETPVRFGKNNSVRLMGIQMAFAYIGTTLIPPLLGYIMGKTGMELYPIFILILLVIMILGSERVNKIVKRRG